MSAAFDPRLYLVTDPDLLGERDLVQVVLAAVEGGVTLVQLRDKGDVGRMLSHGRALMSALEGTGVPLIVNDRADVAWAIGADGVHLGQSDLPPDEARRLLGTEAIIGLSLERLDDLKTVSAAVDYVAASPVFGTPTKTDTAPPLGLEGVSAISEATALPLVAIGGLKAHNLTSVIEAGAHSIAVVSAVFGGPKTALSEVTESARALRARIDLALSASAGASSEKANP
ncbi:MAG: thiamine phosphate synthase [Bradymonadia bacterium]